MLRELLPHEFTVKYEPVFRSIAAEAKSFKDRFDPSFFFGNWQHLMRAGIARTWADDGCVLGAVFYPDVFNGARRAAVQFWFSLPEMRGTGKPIALLAAFEDAAKKAHCEVVSSASFNALSPDKTKRIYEKRGYSETESVYSKQV